MAVLLEGEPVILIEVKEDDVAAPRNAMQLVDYVSFVRNRGDSPLFLHVSRYLPLTALPVLMEAAAVGPVHDVRYRHLYGAVTDVSSSRDGSAPLSRMVAEYLEDIGVDAYKTINLEEDRAALTFLVTQMTGFDDFHGLGRLQSQSTVARGPDLLRIMLGNASVFGDWIFEANSGLFSQRPQRRFYARPAYDPSPLLKVAKKALADVEMATIPPKAVKEGTVYVFARAKFRQAASLRQWSYVEVGQYVHVSAAEKERAQIALYASFFWKDHVVTEESRDWLATFPSEADATAELSRLLARALTKSKKVASYPEIFDAFQLPAPRI